MQDFWTWWQHLPEQMNPVIFEIGWFQPRYYGLMYLIAFAITYALVLNRIKNEKRYENITRHRLKALMLQMFLWALIGGRIGYVLFYEPVHFLKHPTEIVLPITFGPPVQFIGFSGMSFHGGLIGIVVATRNYSKKNRLKFMELADLFAPAVPLGYTFGRLGNFINGELYGRITSSPIGMHFPGSSEFALRHPSQLYEAFFEGIFLFILLWSIRRKPFSTGTLFALYLTGYGLVRFFVEFFRQPDPHIGYVFAYFTIGQMLCILMIAAGLLLYRRIGRLALKPAGPRGE